MEIGVLTREVLPVFSTLLLPEAAAQLEADEPPLALGLTEDNLACGALAGRMEGDLFAVTSLFVAPDYRRRGGGTMLLRALADVLRADGGVFGVSIAFNCTLPEHETLCAFLAARGFAEQDDHGENIYLTTVGEALASPFFASRSAGGAVRRFSELPDAALRAAERDALRAGAPLPKTPLVSESIDRELSAALVENGGVKALAVFDRSCGCLTLACAWSGTAGPAALPKLLRASAARLAEVHAADEPFAVQAVTQEAARLVQALLPGAKPISRYYIASVQSLPESEKEDDVHGGD